MANTTRRSFLATTAFGITGLGMSNLSLANSLHEKERFPILISTWSQGIPANDTAWQILSDGGYALDALEAEVRVAEADPESIPVGYGGVPDADGKVTLDASVMNEKGDAGSVTFLQCVKFPVSVARLVMEKTPYVMLSGKGAQKFAFENGFKKEKLLTKDNRRQWKDWKKEEKNSVPDLETEIQPDEKATTIGMLAIDEKGRLCGACTTSGKMFQPHGRVGDSSIIGAGLYIDGEVGGAVASGSGELVMKTLGSFLVVEFMRNGMTPEEACNAALARIVKKVPHPENHQVGYIAISKSGKTGAASLHPGFYYAVKATKESGKKEAGSWYKRL